MHILKRMYDIYAGIAAERRAASLMAARPSSRDSFSTCICSDVIAGIRMFGNFFEITTNSPTVSCPELPACRIIVSVFRCTDAILFQSDHWMKSSTKNYRAHLIM